MHLGSLIVVMAYWSLGTTTNVPPSRERNAEMGQRFGAKNTITYGTQQRRRVGVHAGQKVRLELEVREGQQLGNSPKEKGE